MVLTRYTESSVRSTINLFQLFSTIFQTVTLNAFDAYQVQSNNDLSVTKVQSNEPIHVYSGNVRADVPSDAGSRDHLVDELLPTTSWGMVSNIQVSLCTLIAVCIAIRLAIGGNIGM